MEPGKFVNMSDKLLSFKALCLLGLVLLLDSFVLGGLDGHCPPLGPVLPVPTSPSTDSHVQKACSDINNHFTTLTSSFVGSAASLSVASIHESAKLLDLHHTPQVRQTGSTNPVSGDTVYRIASISKIFTVLGVLKIGVRLDDPITRYLPEVQALQAADGFSVNWDDVTVGALASRK